MIEQSKRIWDVFVMCTTYNHSQYIVDTLNGFTSQETSFPFVCCIIDDASTDGEQSIILKYFENHFIVDDNQAAQREETDDYVLMFAKHKINPNCFFLVLLLKYNHYRKKDKYKYISSWYGNSRYMAFCEGDDFWVSSSKLQRQYALLENNPQCSMCCHNAVVLYTSNDTVRLFNEGIPEGIMTPETVISKWSIPTASFFFRSENYPYPDWLVRIYSADMALYLRCLNAGNIYYFKEIMSVYRINLDGCSESARMKGREVYIMEQHNMLLESFNKGTGGRFDKEVTNKIEQNNRMIRYFRKREKGIIYCLLEKYFYKELASKIKRVLL